MRGKPFGHFNSNFLEIIISSQFKELPPAIAIRIPDVNRLKLNGDRQHSSSYPPLLCYLNYLFFIEGWRWQIWRLGRDLIYSNALSPSKEDTNS
jgi:hypothetical protein